jgi:phosphate transport system protein
MTKLPSHTDSSFDADLDALNALLAEMGTLALGMLADSALLLQAPDMAGIDALIATDRRLDTLRDSVEDHAVRVIARRQPVANDLRTVVAAMRIATTLERVGDLAKNVAKRSAQLDGSGAPREALQAARRMVLRARDDLQLALRAHETGDIGLAEKVWRSDTDLDGMLNSLFRELLTHMAENPRAITACTHLLFCAKNAERIGDHATAVAETVSYVVTGTAFTGDRPKLDTVAPEG